ncbi:MAG: VCBS repeat-containing protein, partial [Candidatus Poribacteria bacterium]|nr:VCBS repeat-containing protein [Candidatus Poribacteria bacterium]
TPTGQNTVGNVLYRNDGDGTFTDVSRLAGVSDLGYGMAATAADYDILPPPTWGISWLSDEIPLPFASS